MKAGLSLRARRPTPRLSLQPFPLLAALLLAMTSILALLLDATPVRAMGAYAVEPAYKDYPLQGPAKAKGLVIWNHGLYGTMTQYTYPPPFMFMALAAHGWDVIKLDRNPTYENGWTGSGQRHVARLIEEAERARDQGYAHVVLAGQSYGGAIALEAARRFPAFAVVAMAPGSGQEIRNGQITDTWSGAIAQETFEEARDLKAERAMFVLPTDDEYMRNVDRAPTVRSLLGAKGTPFVMVDSQVHGHGGGYSSAFIPFAACATWFLDPSVRPDRGEFHCARDEAQKVLGEIGLSTAGATRAWFGYSDDSGQEIAIIQKPGENGPIVDMGWGTGLYGKFKPGYDHAVAARRIEDGLAFSSGVASIKLLFNGPAVARFTETKTDSKTPVLATLAALSPPVAMLSAQGDGGTETSSTP